MSHLGMPEGDNAVFISHSHHDAEFCRPLAQDLRAAGLNVWYDEDEVFEGLIITRVNDALKKCRSFVPIISNASVASSWVELETAAAIAFYHEHRIGIIPVCLQEVGTFPPLLMGFKIIDFAQQPCNAALGALVAGIRAQRASSTTGVTPEIAVAGVPALDHLQARDSRIREEAIEELTRNLANSSAQARLALRAMLEFIMLGDPDGNVRRRAAISLRQLFTA